MRRVVNVAVRPELSLDVLIPKNAHVARKMLPVRPEQSAVQRDGRQESQLPWTKSVTRDWGGGGKPGC